MEQGKRQCKWYACLMGSIIVFCISVLLYAGTSITAEASSALDGIKSLSVGGKTIYDRLSGPEIHDVAIPGVSYDYSTNTLTLQNVKGYIDIDCTGEEETAVLNIKVLGTNEIGSIILSGITAPAPGLRLTGTGILKSRANDDSWWSGYAILQEHLDLTLGIGNLFDGDIYIEGVTINSEGQGGILSNAGNLTIKDAKITVNGADERMGIVTGRDDVGILKGKLTVQNSVIELKNFTNSRCAVLACNSYDLSGMHIYGGDGKAEYEAALDRLDQYAGARYVVWGDSYLLLTNENKGLPEGYWLEDETDDAHGTISFPTGMTAAGKTVTVTAKPETGYVLDQILVNNKKITGMSFVMPAQDTVVEAAFTKAKAAVPALSATKGTLVVGKIVNLKLKNNTKTVTWATSNKKIAAIRKVNNNQIQVKGMAPGTASITAKVNGQTYTCKVKVKEKPVLSKTKVTLKDGQYFNLKLAGTSAKPAWKSSNTDVAVLTKVSNMQYRVSAVSPGKAVIKVKAGNTILKCKVTVQRTEKTVDNTDWNPPKPVTFGSKTVKGVEFLYPRSWDERRALTCPPPEPMLMIPKSVSIVERPVASSVNSSLLEGNTVELSVDYLNKAGLNKSDFTAKILKGSSVAPVSSDDKGPVYYTQTYKAVKRGKTLVGVYYKGALLKTCTINVLPVSAVTYGADGYCDWTGKMPTLA